MLQTGENEGWSCQMSINSDELSKVASPFDDIGYLPTNIEHGKSFKIKDGCSNSNSNIMDANDMMNSSSNNRSSGSIKHSKKSSSLTPSNSSHGDGSLASKGPSLNDFFTSNKPTSDGANASGPAAPREVQIVDTSAVRAPMRGRRGQLQRGASRRGDFGNTFNTNNENDDDDDDNQSLGMSTIVSRFTMRSKAARSIFDLSKTSLTLSAIGGGNKSGRNDSRTINSRGGSKHNSNYSDPSSHSYSLSKTNRTATTQGTMTTLTKSPGQGSFGSSMFARDPNNNKEKMRETIEQLKGANKSLIEDKQTLISRVDELTDALEKASFLHDWHSVMELAEANTEACKFKTMYERAELRREQLEELVHPLGRQVHKLIAENDDKDDRIAYLEARLIEHQLPYVHSHNDAMGTGEESQTTLESSADSFGTFACDEEDDGFDDCYEENLQSGNFEAEGFFRDGQKFGHSKERVASQATNKLEREVLGVALTRLESLNEDGSGRLSTLQEMREHHDSFAGTSNDSSEHRNKTVHKMSGLTLGTAVSNASTQVAGNLTEDKNSSQTNKSSGPLDKYMQDAVKPSVSPDDAMENGTWAMCDDIISVLPELEAKTESQTADSAPNSKKKIMKGKRSKSPKNTPKSPARRKKNSEKAVADANSGEDDLPETQSNAANESSAEVSSTVVSSSRISSEKPRRVRSTSVGNRRRLAKENDARKLSNQSDHVTAQVKKAPPVRRSASMDMTGGKKQPSRRKLKADDPLGSSTHSNKSSKSSKAARRRAGAISKDPTLSVEKNVGPPQRGVRRAISDQSEISAVSGTSSKASSRPRKPAAAGNEMVFGRRASTGMGVPVESAPVTAVPAQRRSSTGMEGPAAANSSQSLNTRPRRTASGGKDLLAASMHSIGSRQRKPSSGGKDLLLTGSTHSVGGRRRKQSAAQKERMKITESLDKLIGTDFSTEHLKKTSIKRNASFGSFPEAQKGFQKSELLGVRRSDLVVIEDNAAFESSHLTELKSQYAPY